MISLKSEVESIDIVEVQPEIIRLFENNILPQFEAKDKICIIEADAFSYVGGLTGDEKIFEAALFMPYETIKEGVRLAFEKALD